MSNSNPYDIPQEFQGIRKSLLDTNITPEISFMSPNIGWQTEPTVTDKVRELELTETKYKEAVATMIVNYGKNGRTIAGLIDEHNTLMQMIIRVCEYYHFTLFPKDN